MFGFIKSLKSSLTGKKAKKESKEISKLHDIGYMAALDLYAETRGFPDWREFTSHQDRMSQFKKSLKVYFWRAKGLKQKFSTLDSSILGAKGEDAEEKINELLKNLNEDSDLPIEVFHCAPNGSNKEEMQERIYKVHSILNQRIRMLETQKIPNSVIWNAINQKKMNPIVLVLHKASESCVNQSSFVAGIFAYDELSRKNGSVANALFHLFTKSRSVGILLLFDDASIAYDSELRRSVKIII